MLEQKALNRHQAFRKRAFDVCLASLGLLLTWWLIAVAAIVASIDTRASGIFTQVRIGQHGRPFRIIKIRTMHAGGDLTTTVTTRNDPRITRIGQFFRKTKIDELPQLVNILIGHMSFVGPRPDVPGYYDQLTGADRGILSLRPGLTGPATLKYRHEEDLLTMSRNPDKENLEVLFPDKVKLNLQYIEEYSFMLDIKYLIRTIVG